MSRLGGDRQQLWLWLGRAFATRLTSAAKLIPVSADPTAILQLLLFLLCCGSVHSFQQCLSDVRPSATPFVCVTVFIKNTPEVAAVHARVYVCVRVW